MIMIIVPPALYQLIPYEYTYEYRWLRIFEYPLFVPSELEFFIMVILFSIGIWYIFKRRDNWIAKTAMSFVVSFPISYAIYDPPGPYLSGLVIIPVIMIIPLFIGVWYILNKIE